MKNKAWDEVVRAAYSTPAEIAERADRALNRWKEDPDNPERIAELRAVGGNPGDKHGRCTSCYRDVDADGVHWH